MCLCDKWCLSPLRSRADWLTHLPNIIRNKWSQNICLNILCPWSHQGPTFPEQESRFNLKSLSNVENIRTRVYASINRPPFLFEVHIYNSNIVITINNIKLLSVSPEFPLSSILIYIDAIIFNTWFARWNFLFKVAETEWKDTPVLLNQGILKTCPDNLRVAQETFLKSDTRASPKESNLIGQGWDRALAAIKVFQVTGVCSHAWKVLFKCYPMLVKL